jgi:hypothetical protein
MKTRTFLAGSVLSALISVFLAVPLHADQSRGYSTDYCGDRSRPYAGCTVTVKNHYTGASATLYSDNTGAGTSLANPFTVSGTALTYTFYAADGVYDVNLSGTVPGGFSRTVTIGPTGNLISTVVSDVSPTVAGAATVGTATLPFGSAYVGATANNTFQITGTATGNRVFTLPDTASDTFVMRTATQTLTNKTLTSPTITGATLTTPALGVATATSINGIAITSGSGTLTITGAKTVTFNSTSTWTGTDAQTYTFPSTSATIARTDAANTFTGHQTIEGVTSTGATGTNLLVFATSPALTTPTITTSIASVTAGTATVGTTALPFGSLYIGTAATNNLVVTPAAFGQATTATVADAGMATATLPLVKRGNITWAGAVVNAAACTAAQTDAVANLADTSAISVSLSAVPGTEFAKGLIYYAYPTAGTVNIKVCNPTAGALTGEATTFRYVAFVP